MPAQSIAELQKKADGGDAEAMSQLSFKYCNGEGVEKNYQKAVEYMQKAAEKGLPNAFLHLAEHYENGQGLPKDTAMAIVYFKKAAEGKSSAVRSQAAYKIGYLFYFGKGGCPKDYAEAAKWLKQSSYKYANYYLGWQYATGNGVEKDEKKACDLYHRAAYEGVEDAFRNLKTYADRGVDYAMYFMGGYYSVMENREKDQTKADEYRKEKMQWYEKAAIKGYPDAATTLGTLCYNDDDYERAVKWYTIAAEKNDIDAIESLAEMYLNGEGVNVDFKEAARLADKAILLFNEKYPDGGGSQANVVLGHCYRYGLGVEKDEKKAFMYYSNSYSPEGVFNQADCYAYGIGTQKDYKKAMEKYEEAAEMGAFYYTFELAMTYYNGEITTQDYKKAFEMFTDMAEAWDYYGYGFYGLGMMYYHGKYVKQDFKKAFDYLTTASTTETPAAEAMRLLSRCYEYGLGTTKDPDKAKYWMEMAAKNGDEKAWRVIKNKVP